MEQSFSQAHYWSFGISVESRVMPLYHQVRDQASSQVSDQTKYQVSNQASYQLSYPTSYQVSYQAKYQVNDLAS